MNALTVDKYPPLFWDATDDAMNLLGQKKTECFGSDSHALGYEILRRAQNHLADQYRCWLTGHE